MRTQMAVYNLSHLDAWYDNGSVKPTYISAVEERDFDTPERRLWIAVMQKAVLDYLRDEKTDAAWFFFSGESDAEAIACAAFKDGLETLKCLRETLRKAQPGTRLNKQILSRLAYTRKGDDGI